MSENRNPSFCPGHILLQALEMELMGPGVQGTEESAVWARAVVTELQDANPETVLDAQTVLATAVSAIQSIMHSDRKQYLLEGALRRPRAFARTLLLMMGFIMEPSLPAKKASSYMN